MSDQDIEAAAANYRATYDTALAELQSRVWGGNLHLGLFETPEEPLLAAQMRANRHMAAAADLRPGQVVIEAACGVGGTARFLAKEQGVRVRATNIAEMQLTEARELAEKAGLSHLLEFRFADYHNLPFVDASCDVWWCQEALLYSVDKRRVFDEAMRVVRPGGRLIMSDLLLDESVTGAAREQFTTKLKAPNMWSIERWDRLIGELPLALIERQDWAAHTRLTFERVLANLEAARAEFLPRVGREMVEATHERLSVQLEMARAGKLGWCFYALRR
ncbi:MAG TPA: methyltransferase domain-containing protein [Dongiaceae bacterium]